MSNPTAAMLVIGDEILSGRTRDGNTHYLAGQLTEAGIDLVEGRTVSDDRDAIIAAVKALSATYDYVFTSGGIGPTHDDITADCIAAAFDNHIDVRNDASTAPGFKLGNVHVMAGVPSVFQAMVASVIPTLTGGAPLLSRSLRVVRGEGDIAGPLGAFAERHADLSVGSYPFQKDGVYGSNLVIRGANAAELDSAMAELADIFA